MPVDWIGNFGNIMSKEGCLRITHKYAIATDLLQILIQKRRKGTSFECEEEINQFIESNIVGYLEDIEVNGKDTQFLTKVPRSILKLETLTKLMLPWNRIEYLPNDIDRLRSLADLQLDSNHLIALPHTLGKCKHLCRVSVISNRLSRLPPTLITLFQRNNYMWCAALNNKLPPFFSQSCHHFNGSGYAEVLREFTKNFHYGKARAVTLALLALNKRKCLGIHRDVVCSLLAPMVYESRRAEEIWN
jgi:Leucine-rich repeat (LRR) protein